uniref:Uncharacterized protein n=1 Tax=Oryza brachyantha TaxID=4533 RepID=J3MK37_ORYBR
MERIMKNIQVKVEAQTNSISITVRSPRPVCSKTDAQVAYVLGLGRSLYEWKAKKIIFPMDLVPRPNSFRVNGNRPNKLVSRKSVPVLRHRLWAFWAMYNQRSMMAKLAFKEGAKMKLDSDPFSVNMIEFGNKEVFTGSHQTESTKGKNVPLWQLNQFMPCPLMAPFRLEWHAPELRGPVYRKSKSHHGKEEAQRKRTKIWVPIKPKNHSTDLGSCKANFSGVVLSHAVAEEDEIEGAYGLKIGDIVLDKSMVAAVQGSEIQQDVWRQHGVQHEGIMSSRSTSGQLYPESSTPSVILIFWQSIPNVQQCKTMQRYRVLLYRTLGIQAGVSHNQQQQESDKDKSIRWHRKLNSASRHASTPWLWARQRLQYCTQEFWR